MIISERYGHGTVILHQILIKRNMKSIITLAIAIITAAAGGTQEINLRIIEDTTLEPIPFATIAVEYADTITGGMADEDGSYSFTPRSLPLKLKVSGFGMNEKDINIF